MDKRDFRFVTLIGFLVGILVLPIGKNLGFQISFVSASASIIGFTILAPIALWLLYFLSEFWKVLAQFGRYAAVGTLNVSLDLSVLNLLIYLTDAAGGIYFSVFKSVSFLVATTNSYFWNKFWTFQSQTPIDIKEYARFAAFTFIGLLINVTAASLINNFLGPVVALDPRLWANIAALLAVAVSFLWNFLSYRHLVFRKD